MMDFKEFSPWADTKVEARGSSYADFKEQKAQHLISFIKKHMPEIGNNIESYYASTPLTYRDYTGTPDGAIYGIERDSRKPLESFIFPKTKIPNMLFTGQNVMLHGMLGVSMGALLTVAELTDLKELIREIRNV
jgi:all-trans-retinol 13,14-reductase